MDDSCAVCADTLQWVAYGSCGHREVCSTCVVRLRFICEDRLCCLCKSESGIIFITKALGDFTRMINDFAIFPAERREGQVGKYWYHEGTQAYFDDVDHYRMIKAMCRLSCSVCDKINEQSEGSKRGGNFKNVELLKGHLAHRHRLSMCSLCLEGRKVFICEQKLYTEAQLAQHIKTGDSVVDGSETERGGFAGHPICQFCEKPFYGESELYSHMSTEHYTCHICQRQHPGQYEYYKNYNDLEIHFRHAHFLCEDESCLEKKFVVFANESEMKRHNAMEHGGRMSRCRRSAALQIPVSFQYRERNSQDHHGRGRGRGRRFPSYLLGNQPSEGIQVAPEMSSAANGGDTSINSGRIPNHRETSTFESVGSFELLTTMESELSSIVSRQNSRTALLEESSFPPLPAASSRGKKKTKNALGRLSGSANTSQAWSSANASANSLVHGFPRLRPLSNSGAVSSFTSPGILQSRLARNTHSSSSNGNDISTRQVKSHELPSSSSSTASSSRKLTTNGAVSHSSSASNLVSRVSFDGSLSNFPPVSTSLGRATTSNQSPSKANVNAANKSLVDRICLALEYDEKKYASFKELSSQYRHSTITTEEYLASVCQFGLSHLVLELARLCPDPEKQQALVETYNFNTRNCGSHGNDCNTETGQSKNQRSSKKGKEKCEDNETSIPKDVSADNIISNMKKLESNYKSLLDRVDVSSKQSQLSAKGKSKILSDIEQNGSQLTGADGSNKSSETGVGGNKQRKKTSKFLRNRLGDDSVANTELGNSDLNEGKIEEDKDPPEGLPVSGVWQNGGGRKLVTMTQRDRRKR